MGCRIAGLVLALSLCGAEPAGAQVIQTTTPPTASLPPEPVEHVGHGPEAPKRPPPGLHARQVDAPGAYLVGGFDFDHDGVVTHEELARGAEMSFRLADANQNGSIDGFEQAAWARTVGGGDEVLANVMLFDANLDNQVTHDEFVAGVIRLSDVMKPALDGSVAVEGLGRPAPKQASASANH